MAKALPARKSEGIHCQVTPRVIVVIVRVVSVTLIHLPMRPSRRIGKGSDFPG
jgi:hypothetical protein